MFRCAEAEALASTVMRERIERRLKRNMKRRSERRRIDVSKRIDASNRNAVDRWHAHAFASMFSIASMRMVEHAVSRAYARNIAPTVGGEFSRGRCAVDRAVSARASCARRTSRSMRIPLPIRSWLAQATTSGCALEPKPVRGGPGSRRRSDRRRSPGRPSRRPRRRSVQARRAGLRRRP